MASTPSSRTSAETSSGTSSSDHHQQDGDGVQGPQQSSLLHCLRHHVQEGLGSRLLWVTLVLVAALYFSSSQSQDECLGPRVRTRQGELCGRYVSHYGNYLAFQGIPYARPPVGELRFKDPEPAEAWQGLRTALRPGPTCLQSGQSAITSSLSPTLRQAVLLVRALPAFLSHLASGQRQSEDCLFLNVYTRRVPPVAPVPVLVWLHGGGFHMGSGGTDLYGPSYLMGEDAADVVLVTLNYRLGPLGFLSLPAAGVPGNAGLKDQAAALRWVRDNIAAFGGDPERVTIFGESAGGTSVQMHLLSPTSRGLFHGAISQSGSALNPRSCVSGAEARDRAHRLARLLDVEARDDGDLVRRLRQLPASALTAQSEAVLTAEERARGLAVHPFVPSVEEAKEGSFLPGSPRDLLAQGRSAPVPYITGINSLEAGFMFNYPRGGRSSASLDLEMERLVPSDLGLRVGTPANAEVARRMKRTYFGDSDSPTEDQLAQFYSDLFVSWVVHRTVNVMSRRASPDLYVYYFSHDGGLSISKRIFDRRLPGVYHGDEIGYLFTQDVIPRGAETDLDRVVRRRIVRLWTNFASNGRPNGPDDDVHLIGTEWLPANNGSGLYLEIGEDLVMRRGTLSPFMAFWDSVYAE